MSEPIQVEFLKSSINSLRHSIRDIDDSYNNFWDIFAELAQNSVDAINNTGKAEALTSKLTAKNVMSPLETQAVAFLLIGFRSCSTCFLPENLMTLRPSAKRVWD